jgi:nitroimidazol reductase NimA-like FMN-containing flavoprotein (pyridoxamine 5'-phosphate oxidase superfamily)
MRKSDREIKDKSVIEQIMANAEVCRLGLCKDNKPYVVPVNFGYDGAKVYFHTALEGKKIDYFGANNRVCFEVEQDVEIAPNAERACKWATHYKSVIGFGTVQEVVEPAMKIDALNKIMEHYSQRQWTFEEQAVARTRLWAITIEEIAGKAFAG